MKFSNKNSKIISLLFLGASLLSNKLLFSAQEPALKKPSLIALIDKNPQGTLAFNGFSDKKNALGKNNQATEADSELDEESGLDENTPNPQTDEEEMDLIREENKSLIAQFKASKDLFPIPAALKPRVDFWKTIYTQYPESQAVLHDKYDLRLVYGVVSSVPKDTRSRRSHLKKMKAQIAQILRHMAALSPSQYSEREKEVYAKISFLKPSPSYLLQLSNQVRAQIGQKDRYEAGLIRSGRYLHEIKRIYQKMGLPLRLMFLPHVESSFNYEAYSKFGAAGLWQFTRGAGRLYQLKMSALIDERRDVLKASEAAARYLKEKYDILKDWPLAITSYNHGLEGILRIIRRLNSRDLAYIIENYHRRPFGFASSNFYCEFLAASEVAMNYRQYFKNIEIEKPKISLPLITQKALSFSSLLQNLQMSRDEFQHSNYAFRMGSFRDSTLVPKGYTVYVNSPQKLLWVLQNLESKKITDLFALPPALKSILRDKFHVIPVAQNLETVAKILNEDLNKFLAFNPQIKDTKMNLKPGTILRVSPQVKNEILLAGLKARLYLYAGVSPLYDEKSSHSLMALLNVGDLSSEPVSPEETLKPENNEAINLTQVEATPAILENSNNTEKTELIAQNNPELSEIGPKAEIKKASSKPFKTPESVKPSPAQSYIGAQKLMSVIQIQAEETISHISDWLQVNPNVIRKWNKMKKRTQLQADRKIKIYFKDEEDQKRFFQEREDFQKTLRADFFQAYQVLSTKPYTLKRGDSLWKLCYENFDIPLWILKDYNKSISLLSVKSGTQLVIPVLGPKSR